MTAKTASSEMTSKKSPLRLRASSSVVLVLSVMVALGAGAAGIISAFMPESLVAHAVRDDMIAPFAKTLLAPTSRKRINYENGRGQSLLQIDFALMNDSRTDKQSAWELAQGFVKAGVDVNHCDHQGYSALHSAVLDMAQPEIEFLWDHHANLNVRCPGGSNKKIAEQTPLALAHSMALMMPGHYDSIIAFLASHGGVE